MAEIIPAKHQPDLPKKLILRESPDDESIPLDVLFVGAGPAGLAGAIRLAQQVKAANDAGHGPGEIEIGVLEKAESLGEHNLSGAVVNPDAFRALFPDLTDDQLPFCDAVTQERVYWLSQSGSRRIPAPREMRNHGYFTASICEIVRFLGEKAEALGINVFTGFPAESLLVDGNKVIGVRTVATGLDRDSNPGPNYMPPGDITSRVTVLCDGTRSPLAQAWQAWQQIQSPNPQIFALGVKELWRTPKNLDGIVHTLGWPLPRSAFGGSWAYPMGENTVSVGLVVGLDYRQHSLDVHQLTQQLKDHPLFREMLDGGELLEWGAKTIPEGGFHSLPERLHGDGLLMAGDAAGFVNVAALKGIHYAMHSGLCAADTILDALKADDTSSAALAGYDRRIAESPIRTDLYRTRNMRLAFKSGFFMGGIKAFMMDLSRGAFPGGRIASESDADEPKDVSPAEPFSPDGSRTLSKVDAVFRSGNATRDDIPGHLTAIESVPAEVAQMYEHLCPAGVYEWDGEQLRINAPNCVDCKATDVLGPRWMPREGGSGPRYKKM
ncbi:MAG: electron transfer flavoprotein-ubiquinone oxidoreductase [Acidobacteriota bacterium]|nr:electron transfer flavoprotein-ubiquinone oxidoreductase [Acidobacteriota bacterium]